MSLDPSRVYLLNSHYYLGLWDWDKSICIFIRNQAISLNWRLLQTRVYPIKVKLTHFLCIWINILVGITRFVLDFPVYFNAAIKECFRSKRRVIGPGLIPGHYFSLCRPPFLARSDKTEATKDELGFFRYPKRSDISGHKIQSEV